ncbi:hypothetical protein ACG83_00115 [Frankia sp. R43]|nr:hypothetical protein ACG83_00115 [Frankia sp. R43]
MYVASLLDYNYGMLHGLWVEADQEAAELRAAVNRMLARSPTAARTGEAAEEWAIHDFGGGGFERLPIRETEWLEDVARMAALVAEHGEAFIVLARYAGLDDLDFLEASLRGGFHGHWPSVEAFAGHWFENLGGQAFIETAPAYLRPFVILDAAALAERLESELTILEGQGGVYVFDPNA